MTITMRSTLRTLEAYRQRQADEAFETARTLHEWDPFNEEEIEQARREAEDAGWAAEDARSTDDLAEKLYGKTTPAPRSPAPEPKQPSGTIANMNLSVEPQKPARGADANAEASSGRPAPGEAESSRADAKTRDGEEPREPSLYKPEAQYASMLDPGLKTLAEQFVLNDEQITGMRHEAAALFAELEIPPERAGYLHGLHGHYIREPASDEVEKGWAKTTKANLRDRYGSEAPEHIKVLREYVAARKGLHDLLHYSGLGSHPDVVGDLAERAWALRNRNQLGKRKG